MIEAGLVDLLVREVKDDPGALPLLSHVLLETWRRREGNTLTVAGYRASGGIHGAVAQSAEALYARSAVDQRHTLRDLVLRLVAPGPQGEPVRSRVPRRMVATDTDRDHLIEQLVAARLVTSDDGVLEITHEASPGPGRACGAGSTTTSRASGCCTTCSPRRTPGTPWAGPTASSTAGSGWRASGTGGRARRRP